MTPLVIVPCRMGDSEIPDKATRLDTPSGQSLLELAIRCGQQVGDVLLTCPRLPQHFQPPRDGLSRLWWRERPADLCGPTVPMRDVVNDALAWLQATVAALTHTHWILVQPTTPDRTPEDLTHALSHYRQGILATVEPVPAHYRPALLRHMLSDGTLREVALSDDPGCRQLAPAAYRRNGLAYVGRTDLAWTKQLTTYGLLTRPVLTLDSQADWDAWTQRARQVA